MRQLGQLWEVIRLPFCLLGAGLPNQTWILTHLMGGMPLAASWASPGSIAPPGSLPPARQEGQCPTDQSVCWCQAKSPLHPRGCTPATREVKSPSLKPRQAPKKCCRTYVQRDGTWRLISRKQCLFVLALAQWIHIQRLSPMHGGELPFILFLLFCPPYVVTCSLTAILLGTVWALHMCREGD